MLVKEFTESPLVEPVMVMKFSGIYAQKFLCQRAPLLSGHFNAKANSEFE